MKRVLSLCVVLLLFIGGCASLPPYSTHEVSAENYRNSSVELTVEIQGEEGTVLNTSKEMEPGEDWEILTQETSGTFTISARTASGLEDTEEYSLPLTKSDLTSYATIRIKPDELDIMVYYEE